MFNKPIHLKTSADDVMMGPIKLKQPIPKIGIRQIDPFILLHHVGPNKQIPGDRSQLHIGGHPHRGFEPVTFIFKGDVHHKDSRGNDSIIKAGGVQWMTAGKGIIHSESASDQFVEEGGEIEIIQLWVNLPSELKMVQPKYQGFQREEIPFIEREGVRTNIVSSEYQTVKGPVESITGIQALTIEMEAEKDTEVDLITGQNSFIYVLEGEGKIESETFEAHNLISFTPDSNKFKIQSVSKSTFLFVSGQPINQPVAQHGPFVMNNQTELLEAMRDYQMGKMGILV